MNRFYIKILHENKSGLSGVAFNVRSYCHDTSTYVTLQNQVILDERCLYKKQLIRGKKRLGGMVTLDGGSLALSMKTRWTYTTYVKPEWPVFGSIRRENIFFI